MIEDDSDFAEFLGDFLRKFAIKVDCVEDPYKALATNFGAYDLIILDLTLDGMDGLEVCRQIRQKSDIPIIISSARGDIGDKIIGFERGADDYLPKPYDPNEMYVRILSALKRMGKNIPKKNGQKSIYVVRENEIYLDDKALNLTVAECETMKLFIKNFNSALSREQIVYSNDSLNDPYGKRVDMLISRLRHKLQKPTDIATIRGIGYKLVR